MRPEQTVPTFLQKVQMLRRAGPKMAASLLQEALSVRLRRLDRRHLSKLDDLGTALMRRVLGDPVTIRVDGLRVQGPFDSRWMLARMRAGQFEPFEVELFKDAVNPGATVLDIGANIGFYSLLASRAAGNTGAVYAFEADPRNVDHIRANVLASSSTNITVIDAAVGSEPGTQVFNMAAQPTHSSLFMSMEDMPVVATAEVETVAIDDVLAGGAPVDVVKMDIEGGEPAALRGMIATLQASPDLTMFLEFEPKALEAADESPDELIEFLKSYFQTISVIDERQRRLVPLSGAILMDTQSFLCRGVRPTPTR